MDPSVATAPELMIWESFVSQLLSWMKLSNICPLVGKSANLILHGLTDAGEAYAGFTIEMWQQWLRAAVTANPDALEDTKTYVLMPLFQFDKPTSLELLKILNRVETPASLDGGAVTDPEVVFRLSALELGKKNGLVDEPSTSGPWSFP